MVDGQRSHIPIRTQTVGFPGSHGAGRRQAMLSGHPRILVLSLHSGEAEYQRSRISLEKQSCTSWAQQVFENLPNAEAHATLYRTIMAKSREYELFLKLDADMVLADREVLADLVGVFADHPRLDHLVVAVTDWMTDSRIIGAHMFSNRVRWRSHEERLYVDPDPEFPGEKLVIDDPPRDLVLHAVDPSPLQAFHFGAHRALQASQVYRSLGNARPHNARLQWDYLDRVWRHFARCGDRRLALALLAADMVFRRELPATANEYADDALRAAYVKTEVLDAEALRSRLAPRWGSARARRMTWLRALGPAKALLVAVRAVRDGAAAVYKKATTAEAPRSVTIGRPG